MGKEQDTIRIAHFSDIHFHREAPWRFSEFFTKRVTGWFNYRFLGRGSSFEKGERVATCLRRELEATPYDQLVFSGDCTCFGFDEEYAVARDLLPLHLPGVAVPGNHDYYSRKARMRGTFETTFANWQQGERIDGERYPFAKKVGNYWLVCVCSATENRGFWDARGRIGKDQLERFDRLCEKLEGFKIVVTHYPLLIRKAKPEHRGRQLRDAGELAELVAKHRCLAWLHGHRHRCYWLTPMKKHPFTMICSGSVTQRKRWMYYDITFAPGSIVITRRHYSPKADCFATSDVIAIPIPARDASIAVEMQPNAKM